MVICTAAPIQKVQDEKKKKIEEEKNKQIHKVIY